MRCFPSVWPAITLALLTFAAIFAPGCTCGGGRQLPKRPVLACRGNVARPIEPPLQTKEIVPGAIPVSYNMAESGVSITLPLEATPGRIGMTPTISLHYNSENHFDHGLGAGFSLSAGSSITRRRKTMAIDGAIEAPQFNEFDAFALDGKPLVIVSQSENEIEYRTFPDSQVKVIYDDKSDSFEAYLADGSRVLYTGQPIANTGKPRAYLAEAQRDPRGNKTLFNWCLAGVDEYTAEYALTSIRYSAFENDEPLHSIAFVYEQREDEHAPFAAGMQIQESLRLREVQMFSQDELVRRYELHYRKSAPTGRTLLESVQLCAANRECFAPTEFQFNEPALGFEEFVTDTKSPLSDKASPMFFDIDGDGLPEYVVGDATPASAVNHPITEWRVAKNLGGKFASEKVALLQDWSFVNNAEGPSAPKFIQPELGTATQTPSGTNTGLLLHDTAGFLANHRMLVPKSDLTLSVVDLPLARPFPLASSPPGLRNSAGAVHLWDASHDGLPDLIHCNDHGDAPDTALLSSWKLHVWQPGGFVTTGETMTPLAGIPCNVEPAIVDINGDSVTDLVFPGYLSQGGVPIEPSGNYSVLRRQSNGKWEVFDTGLTTPQRKGRTLFVDTNTDGLPDAVQSGSLDGRLYTYKNTGKGFSNTPEPSLAADELNGQSKYFALAQPIQYDDDQRGDLLVPMLDADHPTIPRWVILRATGKMEGPTFEMIDPNIPFAAVLDETVTLADPRLPRVVDVNNDGADDIAIFLDGKLHIFRNRATDPDVLVGFSDGTNDRDPDDPAFVPNVAITYGHLTDGTDLYQAHEDQANSATYPRYAAVGPQRVIKEYAVNDGAGGQRRYGLQYRDGRYDRDLHQWLGFGKRILTDLDTGETTVDHFDNITKVKIGQRMAHPFLGQVVKQWRHAPGLPTQAEPDLVEMTFVDREIDIVPTNNEQTYFTLTTKTHTRRMQGAFSGNGSLEAYVNLVESLENATMLQDSTVEVQDYDEFSNVLNVSVSTIGVDAKMAITRSVENDLTNWRLGLPNWQTECSTGGGVESCRTMTRTTNTFGEVETEKTSSSDNLKDTQLAVHYERDKYGNVTETSAEDGFGKRREEAIVYDDHSVYPKKRIHALGHETALVYDEALGVLTKETDANGLVTEWAHNGMGQVISEKRLDGSITTNMRIRKKIDGLWRTVERVTTTGSADDETIFDSLWRPIKTFTFAPSPNGETNRIMQVNEYDRLTGNVARQSIPTAETTPLAALQFDEYDYDVLGRVIRHETPWGAVTTTKYDELTTITTDIGAIGETPQITKTTVDTLGRTQTIVDANGGITRYAYGPFNTLRSLTGPDKVTATWTHDAFNRVTRADDPNRGVTTFVNDGYGDLVSSTDALGRTVTWNRDAGGRPITRTDTFGAKKETTTWLWDTAIHGKGLLHSVTNAEAVKTYAYTAKGQLERLTLTTSKESFSASWTYDDHGRVKTLTYPQPIGEAPFVLTRDYDDHGFVIGVRDALTRDPYWQLTDVDQFGRFKSELFGNDVTTTRGYHPQKQTLQNVSTMLNGSPIQQLSWDYDGRLNLKSRTDTLQPQFKTERFRHDKLNRLTCAYFSGLENPAAPCAQSFVHAPNGNLLSKSDVGTLLYADAKHPHAITNAQGEAFSYNEVGNQITRPGGVTIEYTPFDLPKTITQGAKVVSFGYDADEQRIRKTTPNNETLYFEDLFEQITTGNAQEFRYSVHSPERVIAIVTHGGNDAGTKYLHTDHLGSVESVTNEKGAVVEKKSYDPFGQRRNVNWSLPPPASNSSKVKPGFTGHDEEDEFGLVNMRGRLYDPRVGRFTTTDPVITDPFDGQTLNAFAYVRNNPLTLWDPSGFSEAEAWRLWSNHETPGQLGVHITYNQLTPPGPRLANRAEINTAAPTNDTSTTGTPPIVMPVVETEHPSGQGTDDPFGVFPTDLEFEDHSPITPFEQLVNGGPARGRNFFLSESDPGFVTSLNHAFGPPRQTISLRLRLGGDARDLRTAAQDRLIGEGILLGATILTPTPLDDMAAAGLRAGAKMLHLNSGKAVGRFGIYEIRVNGELYKIGKAHLDRVTIKSGKPTRVHQQVRKLREIHGAGNVRDKVVEKLGVVTTAEAKAAERAHLYRYYFNTGKIPPGNQKSFKP